MDRLDPTKVLVEWSKMGIMEVKKTR